MKILVRSLPRETSEAERLALFEEYGNVRYCRLVLDKLTGKTRDFGFVEMPRPGEAKAAIKGLDYRGARRQQDPGEKSGSARSGCWWKGYSGAAYVNDRAASAGKVFT